MGKAEGLGSFSRTTYKWIVSGCSSTCLHDYLLLLRFELRTVVQIHNLLIADMHNHVYFAVAVHVVKLKGNRGRSPLSEKSVGPE